MSEFTEYDREIMRLENSLAAALERARRAEELLATDKKRFQATIDELTAQLMDPKAAEQQIATMNSLLAQKNTALEVLTKRLDDMRKELVGLINV